MFTTESYQQEDCNNISCHTSDFASHDWIVDTKNYDKNDDCARCFTFHIQLGGAAHLVSGQKRDNFSVS
jgi:hypothetical protein